MSQFSVIYCNQTISADIRVNIFKKINRIALKLWNLELSLGLHAVKFSGSLSRTTTSDHSRSPHCSRRGLSLPLVQRKCEYGTLRITPHIWMLVHVICTISLYMRVKLCVCRGMGKYDGVFGSTSTVWVSGGRFLSHCLYIVFVAVLFTFRKRKDESLNLYSLYDGYMMVKVFTWKIVPVT